MKAMLAVPVLLLAACAPSVEGNDVRAAREALGNPMVILATATAQAADSVDYIRHTAERGEPMELTLDALDGAAETLRVAADDAQRAVSELVLDPGTSGAAAAELVADAVARGREGAAAVEAEAGYLAQLVEVDKALQAAVDAWEDPQAAGTQARQLNGLATELAALDPEPAGCPALRDNRIRWAELLADRSARLAEADVSRYERLREALLREPFGQNRRAADAADRTCWWRRSSVAQTAVVVEALMEAFEAAVS